MFWSLSVLAFCPSSLFAVFHARHMAPPPSPPYCIAPQREPKLLSGRVQQNSSSSSSSLSRKGVAPASGKCMSWTGHARCRSGVAIPSTPKPMLLYTPLPLPRTTVPPPPSFHPPPHLSPPPSPHFPSLPSPPRWYWRFVRFLEYLPVSLHASAKVCVWDASHAPVFFLLCLLA